VPGGCQARGAGPTICAFPSRQVAVFATLEDDRGGQQAGERNADERYREPSLFTLIERPD